jgi:hypothetical protein
MSLEDGRNGAAESARRGISTTHDRPADVRRHGTPGLTSATSAWKPRPISTVDKSRRVMPGLSVARWVHNSTMATFPAFSVTRRTARTRLQVRIAQATKERRWGKVQAPLDWQAINRNVVVHVASATDIRSEASLHLPASPRCGTRVDSKVNTSKLAVSIQQYAVDEPCHGTPFAAGTEGSDSCAAVGTTWEIPARTRTRTLSRPRKNNCRS